MAVPWLKILNAAMGVSDVARAIKGRAAPAPDQDQLSVGARGGPLEARLAGVVVAALKEAFERDHQRLELERQQIDSERQRADRALRLELARQGADREIARQRLLAAVAVVCWLATLFFAGSLLQASVLARVGLGIGWLLLLGALAASFTAQAAVGQSLARVEPGGAAPLATSGPTGAAAQWLIVGGLAAIAFAVLFA